MEMGIDGFAVPWVAAGREQGGRDTQQDEVICLHDPDEDARLLVLADGMGGHGAGELAAEGVVRVARQLWSSGLWREQPGAVFLEMLCQDAHEELRRRGRELGQGSEPHSTVVALLIRGARAYWVHVGDSRLYRFQGLRCVSRTQDHSLAQLKVDRGELMPDQLAVDPDQHKLLRGLGGPHPPQVDHGAAALRGGETFVLCSDGVWAHLSDGELANFARRRDQAQALREALALAVARGGVDGDNVSLIFAQPPLESWLQRFKDKLRPAARMQDKV